MYELVIVWDTGETTIYTYDTMEDAEEGGKGMKMTLGNQIGWWGTRKQVTSLPSRYWEPGCEEDDEEDDNDHINETLWMANEELPFE